jgi:hypothetical protein
MQAGMGEGNSLAGMVPWREAAVRIFGPQGVGNAQYGSLETVDFLIDAFDPLGQREPLRIGFEGLENFGPRVIGEGPATRFDTGGFQFFVFTFGQPEYYRAGSRCIWHSDNQATDEERTTEEGFRNL